MTLTFNAETHEYRVGERVLPSVTQIIRDAGLMGSAIDFYTPGSATRGTYVAEATALDDIGKLDESTVDPAIAGYIAAWRRFRDEAGFTVEQVEIPRANAVMGFAGTPDRLGMFEVETVGVDIKTGSYARWHDVQVGGYSILCNVDKWFGVYLKDDGSYKLRELNVEHGVNVFMACLTLRTWKENR